LIPIFPLDGGRVLAALRSTEAPMLRSEKISLGTQAVGLALVLFVLWHVAGSAANY
jgi:Zn-dependent protease